MLKKNPYRNKKSLDFALALTGRLEIKRTVTQGGAEYRFALGCYVPTLQAGIFVSLRVLRGKNNAGNRTTSVLRPAILVGLCSTSATIPSKGEVTGYNAVLIQWNVVLISLQHCTDSLQRRTDSVERCTDSVERSTDFTATLH